jgi:hypothetical protein
MSLKLTHFAELRSSLMRRLSKTTALAGRGEAEIVSGTVAEKGRF